MIVDGVKIEEEKASLLFCTMSDLWDGIMNISNTMDLTVDSMVSLLLSEESRRKGGVSSSGEAMTVTDRSTKKGYDGRDNSRSMLRGHKTVRC